MSEQHRISIIAAVLMATMSGLPLQSYAASEQRCTALGANCFCSEPLNTNNYPTFNGFWQNPGDTSSSDKQCSFLSSPAGMAFESGSLNVFGANSGEAWNALPAGHSLSWIARQPDGGGSMDLGTEGPGSVTSGNGTKVRAARFYIFWSSNYDFTGDGSCTNAKMVQAAGGSQQTIYIKHINGGTFNDGHLLQWSPNFQDCCGGPWPDGWSTSAARGKWWRVELHIINPQGGTNNAARMRLFLKNVTDNLPEVTVTDTGVSGAGWQTSPNMTPGSGGGTDFFNGARAHQFRSGTNCGGHNAWSHFMYAKWDTDTGQRIGAASEIEGGADPVSPAAPFLRQP